MFYPQLVAGPIERPQNLLHQLREKHSFEYARAVSGLKLILWGMFKKVVVADRLAVYVNAVYNNQAEHSGASLALATVFFAFQIYCDFSGYSDIAIGSARVMGIDLMTNFRRPYLSRSIAEFWKRWHISLSTWFRDYVYIPLGGNRVSNARLYFNLMITFLISGLWHGANWTFVAWGGINGAYLVSGIWINKLLSKTLVSLKTLQGIAGIAGCFVLVCLTWVYFRASSIGEAHEILGKIFTSHNSLFTGPVSGFIYSLAGLSVVILHDITEEYRIESLRFFSHDSSWVRRTAYAATVMAIMLFGVCDGGQFIYFQF